MRLCTHMDIYECERPPPTALVRDHFRQSYKIISLFCPPQNPFIFFTLFLFQCVSFFQHQFSLVRTLSSKFSPSLTMFALFLFRLTSPHCRSNVNYFVCFLRLSFPRDPHLRTSWHCMCRHLNVVDNITTSSDAVQTWEHRREKKHHHIFLSRKKSERHKELKIKRNLSWKWLWKDYITD